MLRILLVAVIMITANSFTENADAQSRRPRFFQKIKDDLFGGSQAQQQSQKKAQQDAAAKQQQSRQQQARGRQANQSSGRVPTPVSQSGRAPVPAKKSSIYGNRNNSTSSRDSKTSLSFGDTPKNVRPATRSKRNGFGFQIALSSKEKLIVSSVDRGGNAEEAGLRRGDQILEIGGIEATSVEEFDEIAKVMGQGDEMEFKFGRSGRDKKVNIRFGQLPEMEDIKDLETAKTTDEKRYDFAPPSSNDFKGSKSVLDRSTERNPMQPVSANFNDKSRQQIQFLNQRIVEQNQQIRKLQQEIQRLRRGYRSR